MKFIQAFVVVPKSFTKQLQSIQKAAAKMLTRTTLRNHNRQLNPLPVYLRLTKLILLSSYFEKSWCHFYIYLQYDPTAASGYLIFKAHLFTCVFIHIIYFLSSPLIYIHVKVYA